MYGISDLQKLVEMLSYLGIIGPGSYPAHSVVLGAGAHADPGTAGTLLASNGPAADPSFQSLAALGIQGALGYTPARSGANTDITSLSAPALGSATATTQPRGTNNTTVATTAYLLRQSPFLNILDYGGDNTGASDNVAAFNAAVAAAPAGQVCIYFPAGVYAFANPCVYTFATTNPASITIMGAGSDATVLKFSNGGFPGISIGFDGPYNSAHIRDLTVASTVSPGGNTGIFLNQTMGTVANPGNAALSDITNVTIRGADGYVISNGWGVGINVFGVSNINFTNVTGIGPSFTSKGVQLSASATALGVVYNFQGCTFNYLGIGLYYAANIQGVTVNQCNMTGCNNGIVVPSGQPGLDQLTVTNSQFNTNNNGILTQSNVGVIMLANNFFLVQNSSNGITLQNYSEFSIMGNTFNPATGSPSAIQGISIDSWASSSGVITGNALQQMTTAINLGGASKNVNVQSNSYFLNGTNVTNSGTGNTIGGGSI